MAIQFRADLQGFAAHRQPCRQRVQDRAAIAQAAHAIAIEQVRIDARHLGRNVCAQAHGAPAKLVDQLEGTQLHVVAASGKQRVHVLEQRRQGQLITVQPKAVQQGAAQCFDAPRFGRQHVGDVFRQRPVGHAVLSFSGDNQIQQGAAGDRGGADEAQLAVAQLGHATEGFAPSHRRDQWRQTFDHQHQGQSGQECRHECLSPLPTCPCRSHRPDSSGT